MLPSVVPRLATDSAVRVFPGVWKPLFHAKMSSIKDRNGMDLTEVEDIKKRWQEYTENCQKRSSQPR